VKTGEVIEIKIEKLDATGKGVAKPDGFVIFVQGAIPGQKLKVKIIKRKKNYAEASIVEVIEKSPIEKEPLCSVFPQCGGCSWQTVPYEEQVKIKESLVKEMLTHIGGLDITIKPIIASPVNIFYRNKMEFSFGSNEQNEAVLGMHERGYFSKIVEIKDCILQSVESNKLVGFFSTFARKSGLPVYNNKIHSGFMRHLIIREGKNTNERMVNFVTTSHILPTWQNDFLNEFNIFLKKENIGVNSLLHTINDKVSDIAFGDKIKVLYGKEYINEKIGDLLFKISPYSFFQTNSAAAFLLYKKIEELAACDKATSVLDLYCGTGGIGLFLAKNAKIVMGVDSFAGSIHDARENAKLNNIFNAEFFAADTKKFIQDLASRKFYADIIIVDPPREGLNSKVIQILSILNPKKIIYVSCNPATMSRDLSSLSSFEFQTSEIQPLDLFPHTPHIECVASLVRK